MASNVWNAFRITSRIEPNSERMLLNHINAGRCSFHSGKLPEKWNFSRGKLYLSRTVRYVGQATLYGCRELRWGGIPAGGRTQSRPGAGGLEGNHPSQEQVSPPPPPAAPRGEKTSFSGRSSPAAETMSERQAEAAPRAHRHKLLTTKTIQPFYIVLLNFKLIFLQTAIKLAKAKRFVKLNIHLDF